MGSVKNVLIMISDFEISNIFFIPNISQFFPKS